jgi:ribosomal protein S18 acetylase RimI-like enzyme
MLFGPPYDKSAEPARRRGRCRSRTCPTGTCTWPSTRPRLGAPCSKSAADSAREPVASPGVIAGEGLTVALRPMTADEFRTWQDAALPGYIDSIVEATRIPVETATELANKQWAELLPAGRETADAWLRTVLADDEPVGVLWLARHPQRPDAAFVYDIVIDEAERGRGLGRAAMLAAEDLVRELGFGEIGLNVFGPNERARRMYDSLGYDVVATQMLKRLD